MTILPIAVVVLLAAGCMKRSYQPIGEGPPLNVSGIYESEETLQSTTCGPVATRKQKVRVEVQQPPAGGTIKLVYDARPYDARLLPNGNFTATPLAVTTSGVTYTTAITGRFTDTGFHARVAVRVDDGPRARGDSRPPGCNYELRWAATKL